MTIETKVNSGSEYWSLPEFVHNWKFAPGTTTYDPAEGKAWAMRVHDWATRLRNATDIAQLEGAANEIRERSHELHVTVRQGLLKLYHDRMDRMMALEV